MDFLKLASVIFYQTFSFSPNDSSSTTIINIFNSSKKALFVLEILKFYNFFPSLPHFPDWKRQIEVEWFMSGIGFHKFADIIFGITQKALYIEPSNLVR